MRFIILLIVPFLIIGCDSGCTPPDTSSQEDPSLAPPFDVLKNSNCFRIGGVGYAGQIPPEHIALVKLMEMTDSSQQLENLFSKGSTTGRLYALLGLYYVDHNKYEKLLPKLNNLSQEVETMAGCLVFKQKVADIIKQIENGDYDLLLKIPLKNNSN